MSAESKYDHGPFLCRVHQEVVDGAVVRVMFELILETDTVEMADDMKFVTLMCPVDLTKFREQR